VAGGGGAAGAHPETAQPGGAGGGETGEDAPASPWYGDSGKGGTQSAGGSGGDLGGEPGNFHWGGHGRESSGTGGGDGYYGGGAGDDHQGGGGGSGYIGGPGVTAAKTKAGILQEPAGTTDLLYEHPRGQGGADSSDGHHGRVVVSYPTHEIFTMTFDSLVEGSSFSRNAVYEENGIRAVSHSDNGGFYDPLNGFATTPLYLDGNDQYIEFSRINGRPFDLTSFWLLSTGQADGWIETSKTEGQIPIGSPTAPTQLEFSDAEFTGITWFRVGTPEQAMQVDTIVIRDYVVLMPSSNRVVCPLVIENNSPTALQNHPVCIELNTAVQIANNAMRPDCGDIRVFDETGGVRLSYWVDPDTLDSVQTRIWVRIPVIPAQGETIVYLHYGDADATSLSSGDDTFDFFDDFSGNEINVEKWTVADAAGWSVSGGWLHGTSTLGRLESIPVFGAGATLEIKTRLGILAPNGHMAGGFYDQSADGFGYLWHPANDHYRNDGNWVMIEPSLVPDDYWLRISSINPSQVTYAVWAHHDLGEAIRGGVVENRISNESVVLGRRYDEQHPGQAYEASWDWIRIRPYLAVEPTVTFLPSNAVAIRGRVLDAATGDGVQGVRVQFSDLGPATTGSDGRYVKYVPFNWSGAVMPETHDIWSYDPAERHYDHVQEDQEDQDYELRGTENWLFRRPVVVENRLTATLFNFQVCVEMDTQSLMADGRMRSDGGDIRFTTGPGGGG